MNRFKDKILEAINADKKNWLGIFSMKNEYWDLFTKMSSLDNNFADFVNSPDDVFDNIDYQIYPKNYFFDNIDFSEIDNCIPQKANLIVTVNGFFSKEKSRIISKKLTTLSLAEKSKTIFFEIEQHFLEYFDSYGSKIAILNAILAKDGVYIHIPEDTFIEEPIYILNITTEQDNHYFFNCRRLVVAGKNSKAQIIETDLHLSEYNSLIVNIFLMRLAENSNIDYYKLNTNLINSKQQHSNVSQIVKNNFSLAENSKLKYLTYDSDIYFGKDKVHFVFNGENSEADMLSFSLLKNNTTIDLKTLAAQLAPQTKFNQTVKVIAYDNSNFAFDGKILVGKDAQKVNSAQNSRVILMSDDATVSVLPELEIYADDVNCSHGSAIGSLDEDLIFYLNSRGISNEQAYQLLLTGFADEILDEIPFDNIRKSILKNLMYKICS